MGIAGGGGMTIEGGGMPPGGPCGGGWLGGIPIPPGIIGMVPGGPVGGGLFMFRPGGGPGGPPSGGGWPGPWFMKSDGESCCMWNMSGRGPPCSNILRSASPTL